MRCRSAVTTGMIGTTDSKWERVIRCQFIFSGKNDELTSRQESSGKGDSWKLETFQMETLRVTNPVR